MSNKGIALLAGAALAVVGCSRQNAMDDQMRQDLDAASASSFELAPAGGGQKVVSAIEQMPHNSPAERTPHGSSNAESRSSATPNPERRDTAAQNAGDGPPAMKPLPKSSVSSPPPGGYKTMEEVLRKAPFPIKP